MRQEAVIVVSVSSTIEVIDSMTYSGKISDRASVRPDDREVVLDFTYRYAKTKRQLLKKMSGLKILDPKQQE